MTMKREPSISEQQAREIVERMGRRESRSEKSMDDFYRNIGLSRTSGTTRQDHHEKSGNSYGG